jgi:hypothetical protein
LARLKPVHYGRVFLEKSISGDLRVLGEHQIPIYPTSFGDENIREVNKVLKYSHTAPDTTPCHQSLGRWMDKKKGSSVPGFRIVFSS